MIYIFCVLGGLVVGSAMAWLIASSRTAKSAASQVEEASRRANDAEGQARSLDATATELRNQNQKLSDSLAKLQDQLNSENSARVRAETQLEEARQKLEDEKKLLNDAQTKLTDTFKALAGDTLNSNTSAFLKLAKETLDKVVTDAKGDLGKRQEAIQGMVRPLSESIAKFEEHVRAVEKNRQDAYSGLAEHLTLLTASQQQLKQETANLVTALRKPQVRGRWGEMTLRRVAELAGMSEHCDFAEQVTADSENGRQRPDLVVRLPADREVVVDAKVSLDAYLDAIDAESEEVQKTAMSRHATQVRSHMNTLASKAYWAQFPKAPEFVVMFIPGESFFGAAVDADRSLIEDGLRQRVILATPTTLIALLRAVVHAVLHREDAGDLVLERGERRGDLLDLLRARAWLVPEHHDVTHRAVRSGSGSGNRRSLRGGRRAASHRRDGREAGDQSCAHWSRSVKADSGCEQSIRRRRAPVTQRHAPRLSPEFRPRPRRIAAVRA